MQPGRKPPSPGPDQCRSNATASTKRDGGQLDKPFIQAIFQPNEESTLRYASGSRPIRS